MANPSRERCDATHSGTGSHTGAEFARGQSNHPPRVRGPVSATSRAAIPSAGSSAPAGGQDRPDQPQDREYKADQAENPVPLAESKESNRKHQYQVNDGHADNPESS